MNRPAESQRVTRSSKAANFDRTDFLMIIDWHGLETKPVHRAAFATANKKKALDDWRAENVQYRHIAVISGSEVDAFGQIARQGDLAVVRGPYAPVRAEQQYVLIIESGGEDYFSELGFSKEVLRFLDKLGKALETTSMAPLRMVRGQVLGWRS